MSNPCAALKHDLDKVGIVPVTASRLKRSPGTTPECRECKRERGRRLKRLADHPEYARMFSDVELEAERLDPLVTQPVDSGFSGKPWQVAEAMDTWMADAACAEISSVIGHPARRGDWWYSSSVSNQAAAKLVCRSCPVKDECLAYALKTDERHGIWGGLTEKERKRYGRELRVAG